MNKSFGIRTNGTEQELENLIKDHVKNKETYTFLEIGFAAGQSHRAIRDIIKENISTNNWLTFGLDIKGSADLNFDKINSLFNNQDLLINENNKDKDIEELLGKNNYHSVLVLREDPRKWTETVDNEYFDLILIDGAHGYNDVYKDFKSIEYKLKKNGLLLFHDYCERSQGTDRQWDGDFINVRKACKDLGLIDNKLNGWEFVKEILGTRTTENNDNGGNGFGVFRKL